MKLDEVLFEWESRRWPALEDAGEVVQRMLDMMGTISELPHSEWELRVRAPGPAAHRGRDVAELRRHLDGMESDEVEQLDYLVAQPELPRLSGRLRLRRWEAQGTVLVVRGTNAKTVYEFSARLVEMLQERGAG